MPKKKQHNSRSAKIRVRKVKLLSGKTIIEFEKMNGEAEVLWDSLSLTSSAEPVPEMKIAVKSLAPAVCAMLELPDEWERNLIVHSVMMRYNDDDMTPCGAIIGARKVLKHGSSPFNFNSPYRPTTAKDAASALPPEAVSLIDEVQEHALDFINGKRGQEELFPDTLTNSITHSPEQTMFDEHKGQTL